MYTDVTLWYDVPVINAKFVPLLFSVKLLRKLSVPTVAYILLWKRVGPTSGNGSYCQGSVGDPEPDPRIRTSDLWIRIQLRIWLLSSVTLRMQKTKLLFFSYNLLTRRHIIFSVLKI